MSASDALKRVTQVSLLGKKYKIHRLSAMKIVALVEEYHLDQLVKVIERTAKAIESDGRVAFISEKMKDLPIGYALENAAKMILVKGDIPDRLAVMLLYAAVDESHKLSLDDVSILFDDAPEEETQPAFTAVVGKEPSPADAKSSSSRKNTAGRRK